MNRYIQLDSVKPSPYSEYTTEEIYQIEEQTGLRFNGYVRNMVGKTLVLIPIFINPGKGTHKYELLED